MVRQHDRGSSPATPAGITASISPNTLRHFVFTWLKTQGIDDALIQPYSGHATRQSLEIYSRLALADAQQRYDDVIGDFPVWSARSRSFGAGDTFLTSSPNWHDPGTGSATASGRPGPLGVWAFPGQRPGRRPGSETKPAREY